MDEEQVLTGLTGLLPLYPGVGAHRVYRATGAVRLAVRLADPESVARLVRCADGANVPSHVWMGGPSRLDAPRADPAHLWYAFEFRQPAPGEEPPSPVAGFGIRVVWDLFAYGALDRDAANRLLADWGGARI